MSRNVTLGSAFSAICIFSALQALGFGPVVGAHHTARLVVHAKHQPGPFG
jgi:hypothetical protein